jgi:predicted amidohydrolase YtcJ
MRLIGILLFTCAVRLAEAAGDGLVLRGGAIYTLDAKRPWASALVIEGGRIIYVGDDAGASAHGRDAVKVVDLRGRMVLPGFHDAHIHPMSGGMRLLRCRLGEARNEAAVAAAVKRCASGLGPGDWLVGSGWTADAFGGRLPTRAMLDALVPDRPAYLSTEEGFTAWVNTRALAAAAITEAPDEPLKGPLLQRMYRRIPQPTTAQYREALRRTTRMANAFGITSVFDASANEALLEAYRAADRAGELTVRVTAAQRVDPARGIAQVGELAARRERVRGPRLSAGAAKIFLDGEIDQHTAAMLDPYADDRDSRGAPYVPPDALSALVKALDAQGFDLLFHAMGDGSVREGLDALELASRSNPARDRRHQLSHIALAHPQDIARFARLGVGANFQPFWAQANDPAMASTRAAIGAERSSRLFPIASVLRAGGRITAGSDWPSPSMSPLDAIQVAVTRQPLDASAPAGQPAERVALARILAAYTSEAAWFAREDAIDGTIEAGKRADIIVLERNLFETPADQLHKVRVLATFLEGEAVYRDAAFDAP